MRRFTFIFLSYFSVSQSFKLYRPTMKRFLQSTSSSTDVSSPKKQRADDSIAVVSSPSTILEPVKVLESNEESILSTADINQALQTSRATNWIAYNNIMYKYAARPSEVSYTDLVAFDMDGTIITTKSGKTFAADENDWKLWDTRIPKKLKEIHEAGKYIALISNQSGVKDNKTTPAAIQAKVDAIISHINKVEPGIPIDFICAIDEDHFRKPCTGMLEFLIVARCPNAMKNSSVYVGDAAGREKEGARPKDFADSDLKLALNAGIQFQTPERFFYQSNQRLHTHLTIREGIRLSDVAKIPINVNIYKREAPQEIVLLVAPPACGKSTVCRNFGNLGYIRVNQDTLKTIDKCLIFAKAQLTEGKSICVDNTNLDPNTRAKWLQVGREFNVPVRCVLLKTSKELSRTLATYRMLDPETLPEDRRRISSIVTNMFFKEPIKWPTESEAFARLDGMEWSPVLPTNPKSLKLFNMYLK